MLSKSAGYALALLLCANALHNVNAQSSAATTDASTSAATAGSSASPTTAAGTAGPSTPPATAGTTTPAPPPPAGCNTTNCPAECACTPTSIWLDIILVVDVSSSMTFQGLIQTQAFLAGIIGDLTVSQSVGRNARVGIVSFAATAQIVHNLTDFNSTTDCVNAIHNISYSGTDDVNIEAAFMTAGDVIRLSDNRPNARNVILFVTSANQKGPFNDPHPIASQLKNQGNVIVTVAFTQSDTSTPPDIDFASPGYNFSNIQANFTYYIGLAMCDINCFCPPLWSQFTVGVPGRSDYKKYGECLYPGDFPTSWDEAHRACTFQNGYLMDSFSQAKELYSINLAIQKFPQGPALGFWIGLNNNTGSWSWDRGSGTALPMAGNDFSDWTPGYPAGGTGNCVALIRQTGFILKWRNVPCSHAFTESHDYFCQIKSCDTNNYCLPGGSP